ncbi:MAG: oligosaccharide flippase family protein [Deltaproteobacteria bacterium]|nr:oligosaccharide flippase family protein [Deltaproteobacteria bacterium]
MAKTDKQTESVSMEGGSPSESAPGRDAIPAPKPSRRRAVAWTLGFSYSAKVLIIVRTLVMVPLYLRHISLTEYGAWLATGGVISFLTVMDFGLMGVIAQRAALASGANDKEKLGETVGTGMIVALVLSSGLTLVALALAPFVPRLMGVSGEAAHRVLVCFVMAGIANGISVLSFAPSGILHSLQRTFISGLLLLLAELANLAITLWLLLAGWGLYAIGWGLLGRALILLIGNSGWCLQVCLRQMGLRIRCTWAEAGFLWSRSVYTMASRTASGIMSGLDGFLIGALIGPEIAGAYVLTTRAHDIVRSFYGTFAAALMAPLANLRGEDTPLRFKEIVVTSFHVQITFAAIGLAGVVALNQSLMGLWVGKEMFAGQMINILFGIWAFGWVVTGLSWNVLFALGEVPMLAKVSWLEAILRVGLAIPLLLGVGPVGAPISALAGQAAGPCFLLSTLLIRKLRVRLSELRLLAVESMRRISVPVLLAALISWLGGVADHWPQFAVQAAFYLASALAATLAFDRKLLGEVLIPFREARVSAGVFRPTS